MYIYIYIQSPPWINKRPPPHLLFSSKRPFSLCIYYKKRPEIYKILAKTLLIRREIPAVHLGGHLGDHPFSLQTRPPKSDQLYINSINQT